MAIKLGLDIDVKDIEFVIGKEKFYIAQSDERKEEILELIKEVEAVKIEDNENSRELGREKIKRFIDGVFEEEGAFEKIEAIISKNDGKKYTDKMGEIAGQIALGYIEETQLNFKSKYAK